jgi:chemotaxis protein MotB
MDWDYLDSYSFEEIDEGIDEDETGAGIQTASFEQVFHEEEAEDYSGWHIPWSDLMMTMFILFAVMYVYTASKKQIAPPADSAPVSAMQIAPLAHSARVSAIMKIYDMSRNVFQEGGMEKFASVELIPQKAVKILLTGDLLFDTGKADLKPGALDALKRVATILRDTPYLVTLAGHTDDIPIHTQYFPSNWELSTARASAVARFLIEQMHIPGERLRVTGYADIRPLRPNTSEENRAVNRRVEILISKTNPVDDIGNFKSVLKSGPDFENPSDPEGKQGHV